jgi:hypothetical protein
MRLSFLKAVAIMASLGTHVPSLFAEGEIYRDPKASVAARVDDLLGRLTLEEKIKILGGTGFALQENKRLGIPAFLTSDASMGIREHGKATAYANGIAMAATWDTALAEKIGIHTPLVVGIMKHQHASQKSVTDIRFPYILKYHRGSQKSTVDKGTGNTLSSIFF